MAAAAAASFLLGRPVSVCTVIIVVDIVALAKLSGAGHARASSNPSTLARDGGEREEEEEEEERPLWID